MLVKWFKQLWCERVIDTTGIDSDTLERLYAMTLREAFVNHEKRLLALENK